MEAPTSASEQLTFVGEVTEFSREKLLKAVRDLEFSDGGSADLLDKVNRDSPTHSKVAAEVHEALEQSCEHYRREFYDSIVVVLNESIEVQAGDPGNWLCLSFAVGEFAGGELLMHGGILLSHREVYTHPCSTLYMRTCVRVMATSTMATHLSVALLALSTVALRPVYHKQQRLGANLMSNFDASDIRVSFFSFTR